MNDSICPGCKGHRWVCEWHPRLAWPDECDCGAGAPCPVCNVGDYPPDLPPGFEVKVVSGHLQEALTRLQGMPVEQPSGEGMELNDFDIGKEFTLHGRTWRCTDVGRRSIVAIRIDQVEVASSDGTRETLPREEAEKKGWFNGPPYGVAEHVFDEGELEDAEAA